MALHYLITNHEEPSTELIEPTEKTFSHYLAVDMLNEDGIIVRTKVKSRFQKQDGLSYMSSVIIDYLIPNGDDVLDPTSLFPEMVKESLCRLIGYITHEHMVISYVSPSLDDLKKNLNHLEWF